MTRTTLVALAALTLTAACVTNTGETGAPAADQMAGMTMGSATSGTLVSADPLIFDMINGEGETIGTARITDGPHGTITRVELEPGSLTPGWHGLHFHAIGDCTDVGMFKMSGGHMGLIPGGHGLLNPIGPEPGDLTNIWAAADGSAGYEVFSPYATFEMLTDEDGSAIVIHALEDDHISQPIGGAGPRVACGVVPK